MEFMEFVFTGEAWIGVCENMGIKLTEKLTYICHKKTRCVCVCVFHREPKKW